MKKNSPEKLIDQQEVPQQQKKGSTVKTAEDEIFLSQLKAMDEARECLVIFPEDVRAVGLEVSPSQIMRLYEFLIEATENPSGVQRSELKEEIRTNLRGNTTGGGMAFICTPLEAYMSFHGNPNPLDVLRKLFRTPERIVVRTEAERYPALENLKVS